MAEILGWFLKHYLEIIGTILALLSLYFQTIQNKWLWPFGMISSAIFAFIFFVSKIYADMGLQLYYVIVSIYGWYNWVKMESEDKASVQIKLVSGDIFTLFLLIVSTLGLFMLLSQILIHFTDSSVPYLDAFTAALSITATWMLAKKYLEHWLVWIVVDTVYLVLYFNKELYITILLYMVYTIMAVIGFYMWFSSYRKSKITIIQNNTVSY
jgi:nicotinamide mononucleotide transporter